MEKSALVLGAYHRAYPREQEKDKDRMRAIPMLMNGAWVEPERTYDVIDPYRAIARVGYARDQDVADRRCHRQRNLDLAR